MAARLVLDRVCDILIVNVRSRVNSVAVMLMSPMCMHAVLCFC